MTAYESLNATDGNPQIDSETGQNALDRAASHQVGAEEHNPPIDIVADQAQQLEKALQNLRLHHNAWTAFWLSRYPDQDVGVFGPVEAGVLEQNEVFQILSKIQFAAN